MLFEILVMTEAVLCLLLVGAAMHLVEQLEQMGAAIARYRAGTGSLLEVQVPLRCVQEAAAQRTSPRRYSAGTTLQ